MTSTQRKREKGKATDREGNRQGQEDFLAALPVQMALKGEVVEGVGGGDDGAVGPAEAKLTCGI